MEDRHVLDDLLTECVVDELVIRKICNTGIPQRFRQIVYRILLGVLNRNTKLHKQQEEAYIHKYLSFFNSYNNDIADINTSQNAFAISISNRLKHQIAIDVNRIKIEHRAHKGIDFTYLYINILTITAILRPYTEYIQGMADLIVPFFHLFIEEAVTKKSKEKIYAEASMFACYQKVIQKVEINLQSLQVNKFEEIKQILELFDKTIANYLEKNGIEIAMFATKWLHCLFVREFTIENWFRIFDSMVSTDLCVFLGYFSVALIKHFRKEILKADGNEIVFVLQNIDKIEITMKDIECLIGEVNYMQKIVKSRNMLF